MNFWGYRIDTSSREYLFKEIKAGRLRQGWGYDESQDLTKGDAVDESAKRNLPIFNKVEAGDYLLIPRVESWDEVVIVKATKRFSESYRFSIDKDAGMNDYGHIFEVEYVTCFSRYNINVDGDIRKTLKCQSRFWNLNWCEESIKKIINIPENELRSSSTFEERFRKNVEKSFNEKQFSEDIYNELNLATQASEWEFILCEGFKRMFPSEYDVQTTSNKIENQHGSDIIIRIPGILNNTYVIAIQVKDYTEIVDKSVINQICKADKYFPEVEGSTLIDKYLIVIGAREEVNPELLSEAKNKNVKILFEKDVKKLLSKMARTYLRDIMND